MERVLVIDPGDRTGWALAHVADGEIIDVRHGVTPLKDFAVTLYDRLGDNDVVVYETWRLVAGKARQMAGNDMQASQLIGMIRLLCWKHPKVTLVSLEPGVKKTGRKVMPQKLRDRLQHSSEEHDKDALDLLSYWWWQKYV
jgi:hypothetical protein